MTESNSIIIYITMKSILSGKENLNGRYREILNTKRLMQFNYQEKVLSQSTLTRLGNLKNNKRVKMVLILPFDRATGKELGFRENELNRIFTRFYYGYQSKDMVSELVNENLAYVCGDLDSRDISYQILNNKTKSPVIDIDLRGNSEEDILLTKNLMTDFIKRDKIYSWDLFKNYLGGNMVKVFINNQYKNFLKEDMAKKNSIKTFTMLVCTESWELDLTEGINSFILPESSAEEYLNKKGFNSGIELMNSLKIMEMPGDVDYTVSVLDEINIFVNKIYN